jgi:hypothetical protein
VGSLARGFLPSSVEMAAGQKRGSRDPVEKKAGLTIPQNLASPAISQW